MTYVRVCVCVCLFVCARVRAHACVGACFCISNITDGGWTLWGTWGQCSVTCGTGIKRRHRECDNPAPSRSGKNCLGNNEQTDLCTLRTCSRGNIALFLKSAFTVVKVFFTLLCYLRMCVRISSEYWNSTKIQDNKHSIFCDKMSKRVGVTEVFFLTENF